MPGTSRIVSDGELGGDVPLRARHEGGQGEREAKAVLGGLLEQAERAVDVDDIAGAALELGDGVEQAVEL